MRKLLFTGAAVVVAGALATGFAAALRDDAPAYRSVTLERGDIEVLIPATGKVQAKESVDVGAQVSGQLQAIHVGVGDRVEQGDLLAEIDATLAQARVDQDRAQLKELRASLAEQQAARELANLKAERAGMLRTADAISQADCEVAAADEKIAAARLVQLGAQIERQASTLQADLANLDYTKIYAPISGTVVSQVAVEGQTLNANQTTPTVLSIADLSVMTVEADVSEADVLRIRPGQQATFKLLGSDRQWRTTVRQVLPQPEVVNDVVLYKALMDVDNPDGELRTEMTAQVFFAEGKAEDAVLIPVAALQPMPSARASAGDARGRDDRPGRIAGVEQALRRFPAAERAVALVREGDAVRARQILVGLRNRAQAQVVYGLEAGDTVLIAEPRVAQAERGGSPRRFDFAH